MWRPHGGFRGTTAVLGCVAGAVCGNLLAIPLLAQNARVYQVGVLGVPFWVDAAVPLGVLALTITAAVLPALRAGRRPNRQSPYRPCRCTRRSS